MTTAPKRICLFTNTFYPEIGAASSRLSDMVDGLVTAGFEVMVVTGMPHYPLSRIHEAYRGRWKTAEQWHGATVVRHWVWASHSKSKLSRLLNMASTAIMVRFQSTAQIKAFAPEMIMAQMPPLGMPLVARWFAKKTGAELVLNVSDLWPSALKDLSVASDASWGYRWVEMIAQKLYRSSTMIMVQSRESLDYLQAKLPDKPLLLYRTGADSQLFLPKENYHLHTEKLRLVYTGVFGMAHGLLALCQQVDFTALDAELHLYGDGLERKSLEKYCKLFPERGVFIHTALPASEIPMTLIRYDAVLIPQAAYVRGTLPSKLYESLFAAMPIIYHGAGEGAGIASSSKAGLVSSHDDFAALIANISQLREIGEEGRMYMGKRGRKMAEKHFDRKDQIQQLVNRLQPISKSEPHVEAENQ